jgi:hypothetical protein
LKIEPGRCCAAYDEPLSASSICCWMGVCFFASSAVTFTPLASPPGAPGPKRVGGVPRGHGRRAPGLSNCPRNRDVSSWKSIDAGDAPPVLVSGRSCVEGFRGRDPLRLFLLLVEEHEHLLELLALLDAQGCDPRAVAY